MAAFSLKKRLVLLCMLSVVLWLCCIVFRVPFDLSSPTSARTDQNSHDDGDDVIHLRYFVYELPSEFNKRWEKEDECQKGQHTVMALLHHRLTIHEFVFELFGGKVTMSRTYIPAMASFFFIPVDFRSMASKLKHKRADELDAMMRQGLLGTMQRLPYWNNSLGGADHITVFSSGSGAFVLSTKHRNLFKECIHVTMDAPTNHILRDVVVPYPTLDLFEFGKDREGCNRTKWRARGYKGTHSSAATTPVLPRLSTSLSASLSLDKMFRDKDILLYMRVRHSIHTEQARGALWKSIEEYRDRDGPRFSEMYLNNTKVPNWMTAVEYKRSVFCISPHGHTPATRRFEEATLSGCIPVVVSDPWRPPFPNRLNYSSFSLRHPMSAIDSLLPRIAAIDERRVRALQSELVKEQHRFRYPSVPEVGDAVHTLLEEVVLKAPLIEQRVTEGGGKVSPDLVRIAKRIRSGFLEEFIVVGDAISIPDECKVWWKYPAEDVKKKCWFAKDQDWETWRPDDYRLD
eukprot:TRINITY_DN6892_c0_g1_i1.p1 TRINITY_DN6892_c0_g1~~TRINITY_DN6892_c0_g1_i1.p1  ORF type:complete len:515 (+),score=98.38 TRINITY_DN6892_c0_g1_i1:444-1988(+)